MLRPLSLACLPTPLAPLRRASARLGAEIWVKRDDLTGGLLQGNKVRKLDYLMADALAQGARAVLTTGAITSNHCRATATAARELGLHPILLLRGSRPELPQGNLLLDAVLGAEVHLVDAAGYARRDEILAQLAHASPIQPAVVIPEGGSNGVGALGYVQAALELQIQCLRQGVSFDTIVFATGSGGTLAGLAAGGLDAFVQAIAVCDSADYFRAVALGIGAQLEPLCGRRVPPPGPGWDVNDRFIGAGYGLSRPEELAEAALLARKEGLIVDPVYTGKAWFALAEQLRQDPTSLGRRVLFWHTGGSYGLFGREAELAGPDGPSRLIVQGEFAG